MNRILFSCLLILVSVGLLSSVYGADHVFQQLENAKWEPAAPALPPGAMNVLLSGNPSEAGSAYTILVKLPENYGIPAHSHPKDENITMISGTLFMGMGDKLDTTAGKGLAPGGYALMPANMNHYVYTKAEAVFTVHGIGPVEFKYVNPADDPRNKK